MMKKWKQKWKMKINEIFWDCRVWCRWVWKTFVWKMDQMSGMGKQCYARFEPRNASLFLTDLVVWTYCEELRNILFGSCSEPFFKIQLQSTPNSEPISGILVYRYLEKSYFYPLCSVEKLGKKRCISCKFPNQNSWKKKVSPFSHWGKKSNFVNNLQFWDLPFWQSLQIFSYHRWEFPRWGNWASRDTFFFLPGSRFLEIPFFPKLLSWWNESIYLTKWDIFFTASRVLSSRLASQ